MIKNLIIILSFSNIGYSLAEENVVPSTQTTSTPQGYFFSENNNYTDKEVAQQLNNRASDLINVPFNFDWDDDIGAENQGERFTLELEPGIPQNLSDNWTVVNRGSIPLIHQSQVVAGTQNGLGDITYEAFFKQKSPKPSILAVGPIIRLPTGTSSVLTSDQWSGGATLDFNIIEGPVAFNLYSYQLWTFAGDSDRQKVNESYIEPSISFTSANAFSLNLAAEHTIENVNNHNLGYGVVTASQVMRIYGQRVRFLLGYKHSYNGPDELKYDWGLRGAITFVF